MPSQRARHWVFTLNNYTDAEKTALKDVGLELRAPVAGVSVKYLVLGYERGEQNTPHIQGYVAFGDKLSRRQCKKVVGTRAHVEVARGTPRQAAEYCKKDGIHDEYGSLPAVAGGRSDLAALGSAVLDGASAEKIQAEWPGHYIRYRGNILATIREREPVRDWEVDVRVLWGRTGTGKTRAVYEFIKDDELYVHPEGRWFDGYEGQSVVLFDDFTGACFKIGYLLKLLDRYPMRVPVKGGFVQFKPKHIFFTSNIDPKKWYENANSEHVAALFRRIKVITHFE